VKTVKTKGSSLWFVATRVDQARQKGYLVVSVEGGSWVSVMTTDDVEVQS
jgi:hypothetical protein